MADIASGSRESAVGSDTPPVSSTHITAAVASATMPDEISQPVLLPSVSRCMAVETAC